LCLCSASPTRVTGFVIDAITYRQKHVVHDVGVTEEKDFVDEALRPGLHSPKFEWVEAFEEYHDNGQNPGDDDSDDEDSEEEVNTRGVDPSPNVNADEENDDDDDDDDDEAGCDCYYTSGSLNNVAKLLTQKGPVPKIVAAPDSERIADLQIIHEDGVIDTLGQWDPDDTAAISVIYDRQEHGPLKRVVIKPSATPPYIRAITAGSGPVGEPATVSRCYTAHAGLAGNCAENEWEFRHDWVSETTPDTAPPPQPPPTLGYAVSVNY